MAIYAIADTHLGLDVDKPMDIFGDQWQNHEQYLAENWRAAVEAGDTVLLPGDISWAMNLQEALADLRFLNDLPGEKILMRGNHDYWWSSVTKLEKFCVQEKLATLKFLRNNAFLLEKNTIICGTRGWILPDDPEFTAADEKIYLRELGRLELSLEAAQKLRNKDSRLIACLHYPPFGKDMKRGRYTELMREYGVAHCVYGHIHGQKKGQNRNTMLDDVKYSLVAADSLSFKPLRL